MYLLVFIEGDLTEVSLASVDISFDKGFLLVDPAAVIKHQVPCGVEHEPLEVSFLSSVTKLSSIPYIILIA